VKVYVFAGRLRLEDGMQEVLGLLVAVRISKRECCVRCLLKTVFEVQFSVLIFRLNSPKSYYNEALARASPLLAFVLIDRPVVLGKFDLCRIG